MSEARGKIIGIDSQNFGGRDTLRRRWPGVVRMTDRFSPEERRAHMRHIRKMDTKPELTVRG